MPTHLTFPREFGRDRLCSLPVTSAASVGSIVPLAAIAGTVVQCAISAIRVAWRYGERHRAIGTSSRPPPPRSLPLVELALLGGHYYVRDGHHRLAAARQLGVLEADAEVVEFLPAAAPAAAWHRARAEFERDTGLVGLHPRQLAGYEVLRRQIAELGWYLGEQGAAPCSFAAAATAWQRGVYWPVLACLTARGVQGRCPDLTAAELYLAVCDHKWYRSEWLARDIGFAAAVADYNRGRRLPWPRRLRGWLASGRAILAAR